MHHQILCIFVFLALPLFSSATESKPERSINCYKYEKTFPDVNIIDPPVEEKEVVKCDQCFGYFCYLKTAEYVLGYGCREDFFKACNPADSVKRHMTNTKKDEFECADPKKYNFLLDYCITDYCSQKLFPKCIKRVMKNIPNAPLGPKYTASNVTFTQLTTPAPTTTTTTESSSNSENGNNGNSGSDNNGDSGNGNQGNPGTSGSENSKKISFIFFGIFINIFILIIFM